MFRVLTTNSVLRCSHGSGRVQLGPGSACYKIGGVPALRVADVVGRPVSGCKDCQKVTAISAGEETGLKIAGSPVLTMVANGTTNAGTWRVAPEATGAVAIGPWFDPSAPDEAVSEFFAEQHDSHKTELMVREWFQYRCPSAEECAPDPAPKRANGLPLPRIRSATAKWLYVFDLSARRPQYRGEYRVGDIAYRVLGPARSREHPPEPEYSLPIKLAPGKYGLLLSRIRLPGRACKWLERVRTYWWAAQEVTDGQTEVWGTDPLSVAEELSARYREHCERLAEWTEPPGIKGYPIAEVRLATELVALFRQDPDDQLKLETELEGGRAAVQRYVRKYSELVAGYGRLTEAAGGEMTHWLEHPIFAAFAAAHAVFPETDMPVLLKVYAGCVECAAESFAGQRHLDRLAAGNGPISLDYLMPLRQTPAKITKAVIRAARSVVQIWEALAKQRILVRREQIEGVLRSLSRLFPDAEIVEVLPDGRIRSWSGTTNKPGVLARADEYLPAIKAALHVLNLGAAVWKLADEPASERTWNVAGAGGRVGAVLADTRVRALIRSRLLGQNARNLLYLSSTTAARVNAAAAFVETILGIRDTYKAIRDDDPTGAIAPAGRTVVNALLLDAAVRKVPEGLVTRMMGWVTTRTARLFGWIPSPVLRTVQRLAQFLRHPIVLLVFIGLEVWLAFRTRAPLQQLVKASAFGTNPGGGGAKPTWAALPTADWPLAPDVVLEAFYRLLTAFEVAAQGGTAPRVRVMCAVAFQSASRVEIEFKWQDGTSERVTVRPGMTPPIIQPTAWQITKLSEGSGIEVRRTQRGAYKMAVGCSVRVDVFAIGSCWVPNQDQWVELKLPPLADKIVEGKSLDVEIW